MAGHLLITDKYVGESDVETKAIRNIVKEVRSDLRDVRESEDIGPFEAKYNRLPSDYLEKGESEAYSIVKDVPETMVWGGKAIIEFHLRGSRLSKIYLVA